MIHIKNLGITSLEGFSVRNLNHFPSYEWGENGGTEAEIYFNKQFIGKYYNDGNGGCGIFYGTQYYKANISLINASLRDFLKRNDELFDPNRNNSDEDLFSLIELFEERYDFIKRAKKWFKNGYKCVALYENDWSSYTAAATTYQTKDYFELKAKPKFKFSTLVNDTDNLSVY